MINFAQVMGRVGHLDHKTLPQGTPVSNVSIVTNDTIPKNGQKESESTWHNIVLYGKLSDIVAKYVHVGDLLYVNGKMKTQKYTGQDGTERLKFLIIAREIKLIPKSSSKQETHSYEDSDLPF